MKLPMKLLKRKYIFVDFDGTLAASPMPDDNINGMSAIDYARMMSGNTFTGWWGRRESLLYFDVVPYDGVVRFVESCNDSKVILLTARLRKLKDLVIRTCELTGLHFSDYLFRDGELTKLEQIKKYIGSDDFDEIVFIDDRDKELLPMLEWAKIDSRVKVFRATNGIVKRM